MKKRKSLTAVLAATLLITACSETTSDNSEIVDAVKGQLEAPSSEEEQTAPNETVESPQTVEERIQEIKKLYANIQRSPNQDQDCTTKSKTTINYDVIEEGIPFENKAKECQLEDDLMYQQVTLNGYEWSETTSFYYHDGKRFFAYTSGGAEACGYDYRVYYDRDGEIIRVLLAENDCDGQEVSAPFEVTEEGRRDEILKSVEYAEKELNALLEK